MQRREREGNRGDINAFVVLEDVGNEFVHTREMPQIYSIDVFKELKKESTRTTQRRRTEEGRQRRRRERERDTQLVLPVFKVRFLRVPSKNND